MYLSIDTVFTPLVVPLCPGVTAEDMRLAVVRAARELCERTDVWQTLSTLSATANVATYAVTPPAQSSLLRVFSVAYRGSGVSLHFSRDVTSPQALRGNVPGVDPERAPPTAAFFPVVGATTMRVYPVPVETLTDAFTVRASFAPLRSAIELDDELLERWADAITWGAAHRLMSVPDKPYSSSMAGQYRADFEREVARAARFARSGAVSGSTQVQPRGFV